MACNAANCCFCVLSLLSKHCHGSLGQCTRFSIVLLSLKTQLCASIFLHTLLSCGVFVILFSRMKPDGYLLSTSFIDTSHFAVRQLLRTLWVHVVLRVTPTLNATGVYRTGIALNDVYVIWGCVKNHEEITQIMFHMNIFYFIWIWIFAINF